MEHLIAVIVTIVIVSLIMYKNINKITANVETKGDNNLYQFYAKYARVVEREIKDIKEIIEKNPVLEDEKYLLKDDAVQESVDEELSSLIRKLAFFETVQAKEKSKSELEEQFYSILSTLDDLIQKSFKKGDLLAEEIREKLHSEYKRLKNEII